MCIRDRYNIERGAQDPCGGAAGFAALVQSFRDGGERYRGVDPLVLFSGDCFNPSIMSTVTKGAQMVPVLNAVGVDVACYGNHDFDFGTEHLELLAQQCSFPWLISNAGCRASGTRLANGLEYALLEWGGHLIGFIGLVEREWMATLATIDESEIDFEDFVDCGRRLARDLKEQKGVELVIALTHMRDPNDKRLAEEVPEIDLICGGHDHHYDVHSVSPHNTFVLKSGSDFRDLTELQLRWGDGTGRACTVQSTERHQVLLSMEEDQQLVAIVEAYTEQVGRSMEKQLGTTAVDLDSRFVVIRTSETNIGNWVCDVMRAGTNAEVAILNSGTLRADKIIPAGVLLMRDVLELLPMVDELCVLEVTGQQLVSILENSVCMYPKLEGRFLQVSGIQFEFDPTRDPGTRVLSVTVGDCPVVPEHKYSVVTKAYLVLGKDGYDMLPECPVLMDSEVAPVLPALVRNHLSILAMGQGETPPVSPMVLAKVQRMFRSKSSPDLQGMVQTRPRSNSRSMPDLQSLATGAEVVVPRSVECKIEGRIVCTMPMVPL
eukprot:TRINITY_DN4881_c0_g1_i6.p1 TRINITY_DN4881_c0_g1~~TRINITY_DN4881_c0_g1_i6.p1  ORF type:complete len:547 (-),score=137.40 TRINITY_DN4881_c0_g1_i6:196-1836(-)